jgi:hypothetical protein
VFARQEKEAQLEEGAQAAARRGGISWLKYGFIRFFLFYLPCPSSLTSCVFSCSQEKEAQLEEVLKRQHALADKAERLEHELAQVRGRGVMMMLMMMVW